MSGGFSMDAKWYLFQKKKFNFWNKNQKVDEFKPLIVEKKEFEQIVSKKEEK